MSEVSTVFQRRIIIGAVLCVAAFALVGVRLVHVTLLKSLDGGRAATESPRDLMTCDEIVAVDNGGHDMSRPSSRCSTRCAARATA